MTDLRFNDSVGAPRREIPDSTSATLSDASSVPPRDRAHGNDASEFGTAIARLIRGHWKVVVLVAAGVTLIAWLAAATQPKRYRATAIAAVSPIADQMTPSDVIRGVDTLERRVVVASISALASAPVTTRALAGADDIEITAAVLPNTNLFRIEVEGGEARRVAHVANTVPTLLASHARSMYKLYGVTLVSPAVAPSSAVLPRVGRAVMLGLALGVLLGLTTAYALDRRRRA